MDPYALTDQAWCKELGRRLERLRVNRKISREALGLEVGVSQPTIRRLLDEGHGKLSVLTAALRALEALDQLEAFIEPPPENPALLLKNRGRKKNAAKKIKVGNRGGGAGSKANGDLGW